MKLTAIILVTACLQVTANGFGQKPVTLDEKGTDLVKVFEKIKRQTGIAFWYRSDQLVNAKPVTIQIKNIPVEEALTKIFNEQPFTFSLIENGVFIKPREKVVTSGVYTPIDVKGRVVNERGDPVEGVTVKVKGSDKVSVTDANGEFSIVTSDQNAVLLFTHVSMEAFELKVEGKRELAISLKSKISALDELQVVAYGTTTKRLNTGNVVTVKSSDIERQPVSNPLLALQARIPGITIVQNNGVSGGGVTVRIQGQNSISSINGNDPLYVVDGVPYVSQMLGTTLGGYGGSPILGNSGGPAGSGGGNPLNYLNPSDIESIDVLKDADATAIYGSRAANGAILITTKKGKIGQTKVDFNLQTGWGQVARFQKLLNTQQYLEMRREAFQNDAVNTVPANNYDLKLWDTTRNTDWQKELIGGTARYNNYTGTITGGNSTTQYLLSGTFRRETTVYPGNFSDLKGSVHFNINSTSTNQKLRLQLTGSYLVDKNRLPGGDLTSEARLLAPNAPALYNSDGTLNWATNASGISTWTNPLATINLPYETKTKNLISNALISYQLFKGLEVKSSFGYTDMRNTEFAAVQLAVFPIERQATAVREARYNNSNINSWIIEPQANYKTSLGPGKLDVLIGTSIQQRNSVGEQVMGQGYNSDQVMRDMKSASTFSVLNTIEAVYKYNALFGRINYNIQNKYILNITGRRDGSSRFGAKSQFHNFGAVGIAWIFSEEKLIKNNIPWLSFGKIRGSYGTTGNDQIPDYAYMLLYGISNPNIPYQGTTGLSPNVLPNPYLQWEETKKFQTGIDLGLFNDRILVTANYVLNKSSNQLLDYALPSITGFPGITANFPATVRNTAWEFSLMTSNIKLANFKWTTSFNLTIPQNKLVSFPDLENSTYASTLIVGEPLLIQKVYRYMGVDPATGKYQVADINGQPTQTTVSADRTKIISLYPKLYGGLSNSFQYKDFQLDFLFQFTKQKARNVNWNVGTIPGRYNNGRGNQPVEVLDRWRKAGENATYQKFSQNTNLTTSRLLAEGSDFIYADASYIRLKNASLSWQIPEKWRKAARLQNCRIFLMGQNLLTITNFKGPDPESRNTAVLPPLRVIAVGLNVTL